MKLLFRKFAKLANLKHKKKADTYKCTAEELETFADLVIQECLDAIDLKRQRTPLYNHDNATTRIVLNNFSFYQMQHCEDEVSKFVDSIQPTPQVAFIDGIAVAAMSVAEHFIYQDDDKDEDDDESSSDSEINEIKEIWGVDFNDPYLDLDDIPGCR